MLPEVTERPYNVFLHDSYSLKVILYELSHNRQFPHPLDSGINWNLKDEWRMTHNKKCMTYKVLSLGILLVENLNN
jgi:hypothetical protein